MKLEMYRAVYDFHSNQANILNFKNGDIFLDRTDEKSEGSNHKKNKCDGWLWVLDVKLEWGFIPATYAISINLEEEPKAAAFVQKLLDKVKSTIETTTNSEYNLEELEELHEELLRYNEHISTQEHDDVPDAKQTVNCEGSEVLAIGNNGSEISTSRESSVRKTSIESEVKWELSESFGMEFVEHIKKRASLTHRQAKLAVDAMIEFVCQRVPTVAPFMEAIQVNLVSYLPTDKDLECTHDWQRLKSILGAISDIKDDVEQLNWALHEDLQIIIEFLEELLVILTDGDPLVAKTYLQKNQYRDVEALIQYYHMESRQSIRQILLKIIAALCNIERIVINILACSDMPLLLAKEIQETTEDLQKMCYTCSVLTMLLWTGEPLPINHHDVLDKNFMGFILGMVENPPIENDTDKIQDCCIELTLAFNLQFQEPASNTVLTVLTERQSVPEFFRKLIVLANRENDPIGEMFSHQPIPPNSVHKMFFDIFSSCKTAGLFYTSDLNVLIEIVVRKLRDLPSGDKERSAYLRLSYSIISCTDYVENAHCQHELQNCFQSILKEDSCCPGEDKAIVHEICENFSTIFHI